ncbi:hypothetical protein L6452_39103 [Arctium lappa]|uniref:Uncharacterized protein n=1 Tax=Arctium lappa TaxID=4217 RepID=A0ACB8XQR8_ARCLA|nr:hypothetical protein L6452_39103 [Arctium lappa]
MEDTYGVSVAVKVKETIAGKDRRSRWDERNDGSCGREKRREHRRELLPSTGTPTRAVVVDGNTGASYCRRREHCVWKEHCKGSALVEGSRFGEVTQEQLDEFEPFSDEGEDDEMDYSEDEDYDYIYEEDG